MSTRAVIARWTNKNDREWAGRYHHWDGYPSGLGVTLYQLVRNKVIGDLATTVKELIDDHPAGWSTITGADWHLEPGYAEGSDEPCKACGRLMWEHYAQSYNTPAREKRLEAILATLPTEKADRLRRKEEFLLWHPFEHDFEKPKAPACYCHGDRREDPLEFTQSNAAGSGVEWVYVFDVLERTMTILETIFGGRHSVGMFGAGNRYAKWRERKIICLDQAPPNWLALEA